MGLLSELVRTYCSRMYWEIHHHHHHHHHHPLEQSAGYRKNAWTYGRDGSKSGSSFQCEREVALLSHIDRRSTEDHPYLGERVKLEIYIIKPKSILLADNTRGLIVNILVNGLALSATAALSTASIQAGAIRRVANFSYASRASL